MYQFFFQQALRQAKLKLSLDFALDVTDLAHDDADLPIFSFQKLQGACNPLIPDVDFFHSKWYLAEHDAPEVTIGGETILKISAEAHVEQVLLRVAGGYIDRLHSTRTPDD